MTFAAQLRKMITAGLGGDVEAPETGVAVGRTTVYTDLEAAPVQTFETNAELPITNLKVWMEPIQDLHGYSYPWPAGGGKNLIKPFAAMTLDGITVEMTADGEIWIHGTPSISSDYITFIFEYFPDSVINQTVSISVNEKTVGIGFAFGSSNGGLNITMSETTMSKTGVYTATSIAGRFSVNVRYDVGNINKKYKVQLEIGSTPTAWQPYSNICPISGRDEVNVYVSPTTDKEDGRTYEIPLGSTVYGGSLDVTTGALTVTHANIASYDGETINEPWISSMDAYTEGGTPTTGAQVVYPLSEPEIVQLDPIEVKALIGTNNVFSDSGDVSLTYGTVRYTEGY